MSMYKEVVLRLFKNKPFVWILEIHVEWKTYTYGSGSGEQVVINVHDQRFFKKIIWYGDIGMWESYFLWYFTTNNLEKLLTWFVTNGQHLPSFPESKVVSYAIDRWRIFSKILHALNKNTKSGSKKNISKHYDISNNFYSLWLDPTMTYSSAFFDGEMSLQEAQENKYKKMCEKVNLQKWDHVLEIGTWWGWFSLYAVKHYWCKITTVTISQEQYDYAQQKIKQAWLEDSIELRLQDYRDITWIYDKIVSIEMMEALGHEYVATYLEKCAEVLRPWGNMCVQCITMPDDHFQKYLSNQDYIKKHIFPWGELLSVGQITSDAKKTETLEVTHVEYFGQSYAKTLHLRLDNFMKVTQELLDLWFDEEFMRKWEYYFVYCAVWFSTEYINVAQIALAKK